MQKKKFNQSDHFDNFAYDWWNKSGYYKLLHKLNPIRLEYIKSKFDIVGKSVLDIGCGGGILSEELCKNGANVTGIDSSKKSIAIARQHATEENLDISYINESVFDIAITSKFDCIVCFEMIEHIDQPIKLLNKIEKLSSKNASIFVSTINRNLKSFLLAKIFAEYILSYVPKGTHQYAKFLTPYELTRMIEDNGYIVNDINGLSFNPIDNSFSLSSNTDINYFLYAQRK